MKDKLAEGTGFLKYLVQQFVQDDCKDTAAALTYQTLFAVVPLLTVSYTILSSVQAFSGIEDDIQDFLFSNFVPETGAIMQDYLRDFSSQARNLTAIGIAFLAVTAFLMLFTIERAFNEIWRVSEPRHGIQRFLIYWAVLSLGPLLVGLAIVMTTYLFSLPLIAGVAQIPGVFRLVPLLLSAAAFTLIYGAVPNCRVPLKDALIGGVVTAIVFELAKNTFGFVMSRGSWQVIYGTFAAVPLFLLWIYLSWNIVLAGAEFVRALSVYRGEHQEGSEHPLFQVLGILELFHQAHRSGKVVLERDIATSDLDIDLVDWNEYRSRLTELNLIHPVEKGGYVLARDLDRFDLWDLYCHLPWPLPTGCVRQDRPWKKRLAADLDTITGHNREGLTVSLDALFEYRAET